MTELYAQYYRFPSLEYRLDPGVLLIAVGLSVGAAMLGALLGMRSAVSISPGNSVDQRR